MSTVLVTGASGFIGAALAPALVQAGHSVRAAYRNAPLKASSGIDVVIVGKSGAETDWSEALRDVSAVVHLAGPAHGKFSDDYLRREIAGQTARLAQQAEQAAVSRFVFVSSIKAAGARSVAPLRPSDPPAPSDGYGRAKLEAEQAALARVSLRTVVLRPPLVCAADAKANFARLLQLAGASWPVPFAGLRARRSILARESFIAAVLCVLGKPNGPPGVFHIADQPPLTIAEMIAALREGMGRAHKQFAAPGLGVLLPAALRDSLVVDDSAFRASYGSYAGSDTHAVLKAIGSVWISR